ncbi:hypothetical protein B0H19DRAFT_286611 [Mycena capillaripes]|nr:hypothetical protein B0H19DRAFT_286611 [Mycena capillaripes]
MPHRAAQKMGPKSCRINSTVAISLDSLPALPLRLPMLWRLASVRLLILITFLKISCEEATGGQKDMNDAGPPSVFSPLSPLACATSEWRPYGIRRPPLRLVQMPGLYQHLSVSIVPTCCGTTTTGFSDLTQTRRPALTTIHRTRMSTSLTGNIINDIPTLQLMPTPKSDDHASSFTYTTGGSTYTTLVADITTSPWKLDSGL